MYILRIGIFMVLVSYDMLNVGCMIQGCVGGDMGGEDIGFWEGFERGKSGVLHVGCGHEEILEVAYQPRRRDIASEEWWWRSTKTTIGGCEPLVDHRFKIPFVGGKQDVEARPYAN